MDKKTSKIIKAIALIMMIYCHFFGIENGGTYFDNAFWNLVIYGHSVQRTIAIFCKLCVAIFAFISGYGLYITFNSNSWDFRKNLKLIIRKDLDIYLIYLLILPIYTICYFFFKSEKVTINNIITNIFLLAKGDNTFVGPSWYIPFYFVATLCLLIYSHIFKKYNKPILELLFIIFIPAIMNNLFPGVRFFHYISVFFIGYLLKKYDLFELLHSLKGIKLFSFLIFIFFLFLRVLLGNEPFGISMVSFVVPSFVFFITNIIDFVPERITELFLFISKYTTQYWLLHCIFQCGIVELQRIAFLPYFSSLIIIWTIIILTPLSALVKLLHGKIISLCLNKNS